VADHERDRSASRRRVGDVNERSSDVFEVRRDLLAGCTLEGLSDFVSPHLGGREAKPSHLERVDRAVPVCVEVRGMDDAQDGWLTRGRLDTHVALVDLNEGWSLGECCDCEGASLRIPLEDRPSVLECGRDVQELATLLSCGTRYAPH